MVTFHDNIYPHYSASDDPRAFTLTPKQQLHYSMCTDFSPTLLGEEKMHMVRPLKVRGVSGRLVEILLLSFLSLLGILDPWKERTNELERPDIHGYFHTFSSILAWSTLLGEQIWIFLGVNMISFVCWVGWVRASCATCRHWSNIFADHVQYIFTKSRLFSYCVSPDIFAIVINFTHSCQWTSIFANTFLSPPPGEHRSITTQPLRKPWRFNIPPWSPTLIFWLLDLSANFPSCIFLPFRRFSFNKLGFFGDFNTLQVPVEYKH